MTKGFLRHRLGFDEYSYQCLKLMTILSSNSREEGFIPRIPVGSAFSSPPPELDDPPRERELLSTTRSMSCCQAGLDNQLQTGLGRRSSLLVGGAEELKEEEGT